LADCARNYLPALTYADSDIYIYRHLFSGLTGLYIQSEGESAGNRLHGAGSHLFCCGMCSTCRIWEAALSSDWIYHNKCQVTGTQHDVKTHIWHHVCYSLPYLSTWGNHILQASLKPSCGANTALFLHTLLRLSISSRLALKPSVEAWFREMHHSFEATVLMPVLFGPAQHAL